MRTILVDENQQKELLSKGYIRMSLLSKEQVKEFLEKINQLNPADKFSPTGSETFGLKCHFTFLDKNINYRRKANRLIQDFFTPHIERIFVEFEILTGNIFVKPPQSGDLFVHQNWHFTDNINDRTFTIWCPLVDADESNGTLQVIEGSHKLTADIAGPNQMPFFSGFADKLIEMYLKPISVKAGDCLILDDSLIHWSGVNKSNNPRIAIQITCLPKEVQPVLNYIDLNLPKGNIERLEITKDFFVEYSIPTLVNRPNNLKSLGFVENNNSFLTEAVFAELLRNSDKIREKEFFNNKLVEPQEESFQRNDEVTKENSSILGKLKKIFGLN